MCVYIYIYTHIHIHTYTSGCKRPLSPQGALKPQIGLNNDEQNNEIDAPSLLHPPPY